MKKLKRPWSLSRHHGSLISHRVWHRNITNSRRACKDDWAKHDEHENIEKKVDIFSQFEWYSSQDKKSNFLRKKRNKQFGFLVNNAPINVKPAGGRWGIGRDFDICQKIAVKFPTPGQKCEVKYNWISHPEKWFVVTGTNKNSNIPTPGTAR